MIDIEVRLVGGSSHEVDSSEMAFKLAATDGFREAMRRAQPVLLEPIMRMEVVCPEEQDGRGAERPERAARRTCSGIERLARAARRPSPPRVPLATAFGYATALRNLTQGRGTYTMEPSHYAESSRTSATRA